MAKNDTAPEAEKAPIVIPHGLELDDDCTPVSSDADGVIVERGGKTFRVFAGDGDPVAWNWTEIV